VYKRAVKCGRFVRDRESVLCIFNRIFYRCILTHVARHILYRCIFSHVARHIFYSCIFPHFHMLIARHPSSF
jgi:hypothetical protein